MTDKVTCSRCGHETTFASGFLTEEQKAKYVCRVCLDEPVVERQVTEHQTDGRKLLTEG